jgi:mono/diheme cytochrome c family protein
MHWRLAFGLGVAATIAAAAAAALAVVLGGLFDVRASSLHSAPIAWAMQRSFRNHVRRQAVGLAPPGPFSQAQVLAGFRDYDSTCVSCHGGPGVSRALWVEGLEPTPPYLLDVTGRWSPAELKVIVSDGVKMTAMPAWRFHRSEGQLWDLVAFLEALPRMSRADYLRLRQAEGTGPPSAPAPAGAPRFPERRPPASGHPGT